MADKMDVTLGQVRSVRRTSERLQLFCRLLGCEVTSHSSASVAASWRSQMAVTDAQLMQKSKKLSHRATDIRQHSLITHCDKCTDLHRDCEEGS